MSVRIRTDRYGNRIVKHDFPELKPEPAKPRGPVDRFVFVGGRVIECERRQDEEVSGPSFRHAAVDLDGLRRLIAARLDAETRRLREGKRGP